LGKSKGLCSRDLQTSLALLPSDEKWNLDQQLRRSSLSISANIAEGHGRFYYQDNVRFCYNARGSLEETLSHLVCIFEIGYIPQALYDKLKSEGEEIEKMLYGYISFLKKSKQGAYEPGINHAVQEELASYLSESPEDIINTEPAII
jgi:four helix bundle protein